MPHCVLQHTANSAAPAAAKSQRVTESESQRVRERESARERDLRRRHRVGLRNFLDRRVSQQASAVIRRAKRGVRLKVDPVCFAVRAHGSSRLRLLRRERVLSHGGQGESRCADLLEVLRLIV